MHEYYVMYVLPAKLQAWAFFRWFALEFALAWVENVEFRIACFICALLFCMMLFVTRLTFSLLHAQQAWQCEFYDKRTPCTCNTGIK